MNTWSFFFWWTKIWWIFPKLKYQKKLLNQDFKDVSICLESWLSVCLSIGFPWRGALPLRKCVCPFIRMCVCVSVSVAAPAHQRRPCHTVRFMFVCDGRVSKRSDDLTGCSLADWLAAGWIFGCIFVGFLAASWPSPMPEITVYSVLCCELDLVMKIFSSSLVYYKEGRCGLPLAFSRWLPTWKQHNCILI